MLYVSQAPTAQTCTQKIKMRQGIAPTLPRRVCLFVILKIKYPSKSIIKRSCVRWPRWPKFKKLRTLHFLLAIWSTLVAHMAKFKMGKWPRVWTKWPTKM